VNDSKWHKFEDAVFVSLQRVVKSGDLGLHPERAKVYRAKGYFSKDREKEIITDVSIEIFVAGSSVPAIIWVWECKSYAGLVPVDDVEEFHAKLEQIGADRTKGTLIARGWFQESTLKYAASKGIGLATLRPRQKQDIQHVYYADPIKLPWERERDGQRRAISALTDPDYCEFVSSLRDPAPDVPIGFYTLCSDGSPTPSCNPLDYVRRELCCWRLIEEGH